MVVLAPNGCGKQHIEDSPAAEACRRVDMLHFARLMMKASTSAAARAMSKEHVAGPPARSKRCAGIAFDTIMAQNPCSSLR